MRSFHFAGELGRTGFEVDMPDTVQQGLEFMPAIRPDLLYTERKLADDIIDETNCTVFDPGPADRVDKPWTSSLMPTP